MEANAISRVEGPKVRREFREVQEDYLFLLLGEWVGAGCMGFDNGWVLCNEEFSYWIVGFCTREWRT